MPHWRLDWLPLVKRYWTAKYGYIPTEEEYLSWPIKDRRATYEDALAYFGEKRTYFSLTDVPDKYKDGGIVWIREPGKLTQYVWRDGEWRKIGSVHDELYEV